MSQKQSVVVQHKGGGEQVEVSSQQREHIYTDAAGWKEVPAEQVVRRGRPQPKTVKGK